MIDNNRIVSFELLRELFNDLREGADGTVYESAGAAVREQITELSDYINSQVHFDTINGKPVLIIPEGRNENGN